MTHPDDSDKTQMRPEDEDDKTRIVKIDRTARTDKAASVDPVPVDSAPVDPVPENPTQLTQYSASHNRSAGFAKARELVKQSQAEKGLLLKKRFLLEDVLGHGGMGTVYRAKDLRKVEAEDPNPYIATKVLNQDFKDHPDAFVTLQQEAAKSQTLAHPNIVTVHDFDRDGETLFMTMELLEGQPLDQLIKAARDKGLPKEQVWKITRDLCAALAYAHQRQFIHADFKPGNIFVSSEGHAKVLDFGIARAANREAQKHKFDAGQLGALTPAYATIEMVKDEPIAFTDDVYALACVVYEMLAGRHPYNNRSALQAYEQKLQPKRLDSLSSREWKVLSKALALVKVERYSSIAQFADELFPKRNPLLLSGAIGFAMVSLAGAGWFAYNQHQSQQQMQKTIAEKVTAAQSCFAEKNYDCAIEHGLVATNLDPHNSEATRLLALAQKANNQRMNDDKAREFIDEAQTCLLQQDLDCAALFLQKAEVIAAQHPSVISFHEALSVARAQFAASAAQKQQEIDALLEYAQNCLSNKDYACAVDSANSVLMQDAANAQAIEIKQSATLAEEQSRGLMEKVSRLMADANSCMGKKNYSCAIAKAESVLELDNSYKPAMALKNKAQETQQKLKETGFTIK